MDGHDVDGVATIGTAHRQQAFLLVPVLEEFPHTAAVALGREFHYRILEGKQEGGLGIHIGASDLIALESGDNRLDDAYQRGELTGGR